MLSKCFHQLRASFLHLRILHQIERNELSKIAKKLNINQQIVKISNKLTMDFELSSNVVHSNASSFQRHNQVKIFYHLKVIRNFTGKVET